MVRRVGHTLPDLISELVNRPFALGEDIDDLGATSTCQRFGNLGERVEQRVLGSPITHLAHPTSSVFKLTLEYRGGKGYIQPTT